MRKVIHNFLTALTFMTRIPVKIKKTSELKLNYFPPVGLLLALIIILVEHFLAFIFTVEIRALLLLIIYIYLTGALHLDGLGDFADGFFAGRDQAKTIKIMHDSNSGIFALVTLILLLGLKYLLFKELLLRNSLQTVIIMAVLVRYLLGFVIIFSEPAESSFLADSLSENAETIDLFYSTLTTIFIFSLYYYFTDSVYFFPVLLAVVFILILIIYLIQWSRKKLGGITGDIYGTIIELGELIFLLTLAAF
ncbi:cobalamin-5'-phosphate synthase [Halanaerobium saccharolyticum]|uniref:Adenosylcobinamide-GDP ribazoletransferase n=1 Tax=Halanaerobium saccharolyticum TaxID=43595 RepID=A0A4R7ZD13_9FIRM|nr:adenosylcobinamide-GDP ribazoletransferase [Halanaerobium saccharolyticum]RAK10572.1 cobalamin-5'-phosphate synthase [Halanaerobium saccharolyticum]TDW06671.1 cobalamin-5'-phosphate synthase [Halanaerobium saccharolyticum]TDX62306.1 cobalamin-5'-phosphate synthase [Halanaerobium saccharolyticum]